MRYPAVTIFGSPASPDPSRDVPQDAPQDVNDMNDDQNVGETTAVLDTRDTWSGGVPKDRAASGVGAAAGKGDPGRHDPLQRRVEALGALLGLSRTRVEPDVLSEAGDLLDRIAERRRLSHDHTVVALAGATGSGKSSLFNALTGLALSEVGMRRPTTGAPVACAWDPEGAAGLLDRLDVAQQRRFARRSLLDGVHTRPGGSDRGLEGLVLLDLPDHDSAAEGNRREVDRLLRLVDVLVWVVDPEKYADAALHERYLKPLAGHADVTLVVLNQVDRLPYDAADQVLDDLRRLLDEDGIASGEHGEPGAVVLAASALTGEGVPDVRAAIGQIVAERGAADRRLAADMDRVTERLRPVYVGQRVTGLAEPACDEFSGRLADAMGATVVGRTAEREWSDAVARTCGVPWGRLVERGETENPQRVAGAGEREGLGGERAGGQRVGAGAAGGGGGDDRGTGAGHPGGAWVAGGLPPGGGVPSAGSAPSVGSAPSAGVAPAVLAGAAPAAGPSSATAYATASAVASVVASAKAFAERVFSDRVPAGAGMSADGCAASALPHAVESPSDTVPRRVVSRPVVDEAIRAVAAEAATGLPGPWARAVHDAARRGSRELVEDLDAAAATAEANEADNPRWWWLTGVAQWFLMVMSVTGIVGLVAVAVRALGTSVWLPGTVFCAGTVGGPVLAWACRLGSRGSARRHGQDAENRLRDAAERYGREHVLGPISGELLRYQDVREQYGVAAGATTPGSRR